MHEMGIATEVTKIAVEEVEQAGGGKVSAIHMTIGRWSGVDVESLRFALGIVMEDSILKGAKINITSVEPTFHCAECDKEFIVEGRLDPCPYCESLTAEMVAGDEMLLSEIDLED